MEEYQSLEYDGGPQQSYEMKAHVEVASVTRWPRNGQGLKIGETNDKGVRPQ